MKTNGFCMAPDDLDLQEEISCDINIQTAKDAENVPRIGMQIVLMSETGKMRSLWLPEPPVGKYRFEEADDDKISESIYIEAKNGKWYACCNSPAYFRNQVGEICFGIEIIDNCIFSVESISNKCVVYAESVNSFSRIFRNYQVDRFSEIFIGRANSNDIVYPNILVSQTHAILKRNSKSWSIQDCNSTNGVFVNGRKITEAELKTGDHIYIMGLQIIIGIGFISLNDSNDRIHILSEKLREVQSTENLGLPEPAYIESNSEVLFNRLPRRRRALILNPVDVEAPPLALHSDSMPMVLRMGGRMVMSSASLLAGNITSIISSVLFPVLTQKYTDKQKQEYEARRNKIYTKYLENKKAEIIQECAQELFTLTENYPDLARVLTYADSEDRLWERRITDDDFLSLRIGHGEYPMLAKCNCPHRGLELDEDPLLEKMFEMVENPFLLENAPIMTSFVEDNVCGVLGARKLELSFIQRLIMELSILHSYDEVKTVFLVEDEELRRLEFVKYLPHIWDDQRDFRFLATSTSDAYQISEYLKQEIANDLDKQRELKDILKTRPYYMVFALSKRIFDSMEVLKDVMQADKNCGVSVLAVFDDLPKECVKIFNLQSSGEHSVVHLKQIDKADKAFRMDNYDPIVASQSMQKISNTSLRVVTQAYSLPKTVTFLEMYGVGRIEHLNPLKRWQENNPVKSLAAPVGVATDGSLFTLDLHEKFQGPHGLVAGMTGSGKSEFIITYILSMAINYHPDEVAFILIDYKGGGLAGAFDDEARGIHLPHLVGTITNLDGAAIQRSLMSIQSELMRRQRIFNEAKSLTGEGTMDIYTYQKLYRSKKVKEPLPHLFIISDEFAELKKQQPEFMDKLISAARIGRSLGVHLVLATQKPSGVVNDQIRSNTKFRVCLRVQDKSDSIDMLKRPEAAEIRDTGRFYLQVGYNEFFALGQSSWSGATYEPEDEVVVKKDFTVQFIDNVGQTYHTAAPKIERIASGKSQLVAIVQMLSDLAKMEGITPKRLWTDPLPSKISLGQIERDYATPKHAMLHALIGMVDDPEKQIQYPLWLNIQNTNNLLISGESRCGKTTLLQTMLYSLVSRYTSEDLNFYILDFSSRTMDVFKRMPHCGCVLTDDHEDEIVRLFSLLSDITAERKKLFEEAEVSGFDAFIKVKKLPLITVVIDGFSVLNNLQKCKMIMLGFETFLKLGNTYGIKYIVTCNHPNDVPGRVKMELKGRLALQHKDRFEYAAILNNPCTRTPPEIAGRGICVVGGKALEFHTAMFDTSLDDQEYIPELKEQLNRLANSRKGYLPAKRLQIIDEDETFQNFMENFKLGRIPLGYSLQDATPVALPLLQLKALSVYFACPQGVAPIVQNFLDAAERESMDIHIFKRARGSVFDSGAVKIDPTGKIKATILECMSENTTQGWEWLADEISKRQAVRTAYYEENKIIVRNAETRKKAFYHVHSNTKPLLIFFECFLDFCQALDEAGQYAYPELFGKLDYLNIYMIGAFYPGDGRILSMDKTFKSFNSEAVLMMFGGQLDQQGLTALPTKFADQNKMNPDYRKSLVKYHNQFYPLTMPCGKLLKAEDNEDERPIFA